MSYNFQYLWNSPFVCDLLPMGECIYLRWLQWLHHHLTRFCHCCIVEGGFGAVISNFMGLFSPNKTPNSPRSSKSDLFRFRSFPMRQSRGSWIIFSRLKKLDRGERIDGDSHSQVRWQKVFLGNTWQWRWPSQNTFQVVCCISNNYGSVEIGDFLKSNYYWAMQETLVG